MINKTVLVTYLDGNGKVNFTFEGKVVSESEDKRTLHVERIENDEVIDTYEVDTQNPRHWVAPVYDIVEVKPIESEVNMELKEVRQKVTKAVKWLDNASIKVAVYDCTENKEQTYDVEINVYEDGEYQDTFTHQTFKGRTEGDKKAEKEAMARAKAVLRSVKGWFKYDEEVTVDNQVELYHM